MLDAPDLPAWLTPVQFSVLTRLVGTFQALGVPYVATGGLAGNLHGSTWPLRDIDVDVPGAALARLAARFPAAVRFGPGPYRDAEFELDLLGLTLDGVEVDVSAAESVVLRRPTGARVPWPTGLARAETRAVGPLRVRVVSLDALLAYKRLVGRVADLRDLETLHRATHPAG